jgi:cyclopropane fatty-acyl-phospholipid synthase-like methyltransferase
VRILLDKTLEYYNTNAYDFVTETTSVNFKVTQDRFLSKLKSGGYILDFGCGSGRDTKYFLESGMNVDATDGSVELCNIASEYTGIEVKHRLFKELDEIEKYDGIWACASILHLPKHELKSVFVKMLAALKMDGIIYTSFKYGKFEGERRGRYFTDFTEKSFDEFIGDIGNLRKIECWITSDVRAGRGDEKWLNLILQKVNMS